ncbi:MAG: hypothetical protein NC078_06575 [Ruminococcus sp.]|nr:hypothetical protein [Ruminococcus sp.]
MSEKIIGTDYYNEDECAYLQIEAMGSFGKKRRAILRELSNYKGEAADQFWRYNSNKYMPYAMISRCDVMSDICADKLSDLVKKATESSDALYLATESFFVLNSCIFKESDKIFRAYEEAARNAVKIRSRHINWDDKWLLTPDKLPNFLGKRLEAERNDENIESDFFSRLNDDIIITAANAIILDGERETVTEKVRSLYEKYPDVYGAAGFFAYFVKDTSEAYEKFRSYTLDPIFYPVLLWVLGGLSHNGETYIQNAPAAYIGEDNEFIQLKLPLEKVDKRWYEFLTEKPFADIENSSVKSPAYNKSFLDGFTSIVAAAANENDPENMEMCRRYLFRAAEMSGSRDAFEGLINRGFLKNADDLMELTKMLCKSISEGRCIYCFVDLFTAFSPEDIDLEGFCDAVSYAANYPFEEMSPYLEGEKKRLKNLSDSVTALRAEVMSKTGR